MNRNQKEYWRLPGKKRRLGGIESLYEGPDHLLQIKSTGVSENYRRFFYRDIKYLHIAKTRVALIENLIITGLITLFGLWGYFILEDIEPLAVFFWIISGVSFLCLLYSILSGGSCQCWIETDVQRERLFSVNRIRPAKKIFVRVAPLIEKEQGRLSPEALEKVPLEPGRDKSGPAQKATDTVQTEKGYWHRGLYLSLAASGLLTIGALFYHPLPVVLIEAMLFAAISILSVISIVRQTGSSMKQSLKSLTWVVLGVVIMGFVIGYIEMFFIVFKNIENPEIFQNELRMLEEYSRMDRLKNPFMMGVSILNIISHLACGLTGLFLIRKK